MPSVEDEPIAKMSFGRPTLNFGKANEDPFGSKAALSLGQENSSACAAFSANRMLKTPARSANALAERRARLMREFFCTRSNGRQRKER
jgi:hypothetical protein